MSTLSKRLTWSVAQADDTTLKNLMQDLKVSKTTAKVLARRQLTSSEKAKQFIQMNLSQLHDPFLLKDMQKACDRILEAIHQKQKICIYGDYDVDGAVGTSLLLLFFKDIGADVDFYIPCRQKEGYSLNNKALENLKQQGFDLVVTVDNGITSVAAVEFANAIGLDVIVTDHHQVGASLPKALAVVNPQQADCDYPFKKLCGAGVAFKLIMALRFLLRQNDFFKNKNEPHLKQYFDLLCLSTVCDVVPLVDENRLFVKEGLKHIQFTKRPGLMALKDVCDLKGKITATDIGFRMGPRLNAAGRLDDASLGVKLLVSQNYQEAFLYAQELDRLNLDRRTLEKQITEEAISQSNPEDSASEALVVFCEDWHIGVVGIVASRLVEKFQCPVFVLCEVEDGIVKGSGRSFAHINLVKALEDCEPLLEKFGGHEAAAGVTLKKENLEKFREAFPKAVAKQTKGEELTQEIIVDDALKPHEVSETLLTELESLEPFGMGHEAPLFLTKDWEVVSKRIVGEKHLKLTVKSSDQNLEAIGFFQADHLDEIDGNVKLLYHLERNEFRNQSRLQLIIKQVLKD